MIVFFRHAASLCLLLMSSIVSIAVLSRSLGLHFFFAQRLALVLMPWLMMFGIVLATKTSEHLCLGWRFPKKLLGLNRLWAATVCGIFAWYGALHTRDLFHLWHQSGGFAGVFDSIPVPYWCVASAVPIGFACNAWLFTQKENTPHGLPIFVLLGSAAFLVPCTLGDFSSQRMILFADRIFEFSGQHILLAIPFFMFSGAIMAESSMASRLVQLADACLGNIPGGLGIASVVACVLFAAISGSSPATLMAVGSSVVPALIHAGYRDDRAIGLVTSAGTLGVVIPPSIPMLVYAMIAGQHHPIDLSELFIAGIGPGLLIAGLLAVTVVMTAPKKRQGAASSAPTCALIKQKSAFKRGAPALMMPIAILGGIYSGLFSPTEASALSVAYAVFLAIVVYRDFHWTKLWDLAAHTATMLGALVAIMIMATIIADLLIDQQLPQHAVTWLIDRAWTPTAFLLAVNGLLLVAGCFMESLGAIVLFAPMIAPMGFMLGIDPLHLAIITIVNLEIGFITPPFGINLFVASSLFKKPISQITRATVPYMLVMLIGLLIITYVPAITLFPIKRTLDAGTTPKVFSVEELMRQTDTPSERK